LVDRIWLDRGGAPDTVEAGIRRYGSAATTPFRSEKVTSWEGGSRARLMIRRPGVVELGQISSEIVSLLDFLPGSSSWQVSKYR
jgi:hypothetical protein